MRLEPTVGCRAVSPSRRERIALSGLAGLVLFLHRGALVAGGVMFKRDVHLIWVPEIEGFVRAVLGGAWPVWDPCPPPSASRCWPTRAHRCSTH